MADTLSDEQIRSAATRTGVRANPIDYDAWLAEHDREVRRAALIEGAGAILLRRTLAGSSGSAKDDETWDNGNMAAEAIVRSLADREPDDVAPGGAS